MTRGQRHSLVQEEEFGPAPAGHDLAVTALVFAATDQPRFARPTPVQQRFGFGVVDDAAVSCEHPSLRDCHDVAEGSDSVLSMHPGSGSFEDIAALARRAPKIP
jgi:hypothetical protein